MLLMEHLMVNGWMDDHGRLLGLSISSLSLSHITPSHPIPSGVFVWVCHVVLKSEGREVAH